jgi:uncharacterized protein
MQIMINTSQPAVINWSPTTAEEIAQNVLTIILTMKYEVAYDRTLGISPDYIDMPLQEALTFVIAQIYKVIDEREPRATVQDVEFVGVSTDGNMQFKVVIEV